MRNAMNEVLRDHYVTDCERALKRWNKTLAEVGLSDRMSLPDRKFHRHIGLYSSLHFTPTGTLVDAETFEARKSEWLPTEADRAYVKSLMKGVLEPGKYAGWIAPPAKGINGQAIDFEYVKL